MWWLCFCSMLYSFVVCCFWGICFLCSMWSESASFFFLVKIISGWSTINYTVSGSEVKTRCWNPKSKVHSGNGSQSSRQISKFFFLLLSAKVNIRVKVKWNDINKEKSYCSFKNMPQSRVWNNSREKMRGKIIIFIFHCIFLSHDHLIVYSFIYALFSFLLQKLFF